MRNPANDGEDQIDRKTSAAICNAIGERLRRDTPPVDNTLPNQLQALMSEMERRERGRR